MCNLYNLTRAVDAMRNVFGPQPLDISASNGAPTADIYPNLTAVVVRGGDGGYATENARFGLPTPPTYLVGKKVDRGVTNVRNTRSAHWRQWLGPEHRCLVPFDRFAEPSGEGGNVWFELVPPTQGFFAGIIVRDWTSVRKVKDGPTTDTLFAFLTTEPNSVVGEFHPKAMPVILTERDEWDMWLTAPWALASTLQRPLRDDLIRVVG